MKAFLFPFAFLAASASAQNSACAADYIVESCLGTIGGQLAACDLKDYGCQCTQYTEYVKCFNNCPNDQRVHTYEGQRQIFCSYASQFSSSTSSLFSAPTAEATTTTDAATAEKTDDASPTDDDSASGTATGGATPASKTNSAADLVLNAGGVLAAVAGVVAAVL
ncbi:hypothetical protein GE09DRAFT_141675 [Coniochaeta sp. 2T2.1]|nr:hypothetical protein GE09DRAFT_141675 [Coniochaeta sp. 2T2.1]